MAEPQSTQPAGSLCSQLQITAEELQTRLAFLSFGAQDTRNLVEIHDVISSRIDELVEEFYGHLLQFEELREILSDPVLVERLKGSQRQYLLSLGQLGDDVEYVEGRFRIGLTHERVGLKQKWYVGAYHKLFELILKELAVRYSGDAQQLSLLVLTLSKILTLDEIFVVETYYHATMQRLDDSLRQLKDAHRQLEGLSRRDSLTPVNNRRALMEALALEFQRSRRYQHPFALLFLDLDHFKKINDRHGHVFGDHVLLHVVQLAGGIIRPPDIIGRYGGGGVCDRFGGVRSSRCPADCRAHQAENRTESVRVGTPCHRGNGQHRGRDVISGNRPSRDARDTRGSGYVSRQAQGAEPSRVVQRRVRVEEPAEMNRGT